MKKIILIITFILIFNFTVFSQTNNSQPETVDIRNVTPLNAGDSNNVQTTRFESPEESHAAKVYLGPYFGFGGIFFSKTSTGDGSIENYISGEVGLKLLITKSKLGFIFDVSYFSGVDVSVIFRDYKIADSINYVSFKALFDYALIPFFHVSIGFYGNILTSANRKYETSGDKIKIFDQFKNYDFGICVVPIMVMMPLKSVNFFINVEINIGFLKLKKDEYAYDENGDSLNFRNFSVFAAFGILFNL